MRSAILASGSGTNRTSLVRCLSMDSPITDISGSITTSQPIVMIRCRVPLIVELIIIAHNTSYHGGPSRTMRPSAGPGTARWVAALDAPGGQRPMSSKLASPIRPLLSTLVRGSDQPRKLARRVTTIAAAAMAAKTTAGMSIFFMPNSWADPPADPSRSGVTWISGNSLRLGGATHWFQYRPLATELNGRVAAQLHRNGQSGDHDRSGRHTGRPDFRRRGPSGLSTCRRSSPRCPGAACRIGSVKACASD
jgi:hypothetical protein